MDQTLRKKEYGTGLLCALGSMLMWGILPIYWQSLQPINPLLIMFYRLVLACVLVFVVDLFVFGFREIFRPLKKKGAIPAFFLAGVLISCNWGLYIFMVNSRYVIQTSIGYYIEPLVVCVFGVLFFKEKLSRYKVGALLLALAGVGVMLLSLGQVPVLAFGLAFSFACYAAIKKKLHAPALLSLFYETLFLLPIIVPWILYYEMTGQGAFATASPGQLGLLALSGLFTATPLCLFSMAANRISLVVLGITEYLSPSITLLLGIFLFKENFDRYQLMGFVVIWIGLAVFTLGEMRERRAMEQVGEGAEEEAAAEKGTASRS